MDVAWQWRSRCTLLASILASICLIACGHGFAQGAALTGSQTQLSQTHATPRLALRQARFELPTTGSETTLQPRFSDAELGQLLTALGVETHVVNAGVLRLLDNGHPYLLFNLDDGDLQLYFVASGQDATLESANAWNLKHRLSRAYLDERGAAILEADLLSDGGISVARVRAFLRVFALSRKAFLRHLQQSPPGAASDPKPEQAFPMQPWHRNGQRMQRL